MSGDSKISVLRWIQNITVDLGYKENYEQDLILPNGLLEIS